MDSKSVQPSTTSEENETKVEATLKAQEDTPATTDTQVESISISTLLI
jgi:hypothetical protein